MPADLQAQSAFDTQNVAVPFPLAASTVAMTNSSGRPLLVISAGGTVTVVAINGTTTGLTTSYAIAIPAGGTLTITYSVAPTTFVAYPL